ncbi:MAG: lysylphosphatidylglycerol synthase domain-containing protein, partial [Pseudomonadota bacterium]
GEATINLLLQRIFDVLVLGTLGCVICVQAYSTERAAPVLAMSGLVLIGLLISVIYLEEIIAIVARLLIPWRSRKWIKNILQLLIQARGSVRYHLNFRITCNLIFLTLLKWAIILGGIACVVLAVLPSLSLISAFGVGIAYNLAALVPLQTIGGAGVAELMLLGSFKWLGYTTAAGASLAIAIRLALLLGPSVFAILLLAYFEILAPKSTMVAAHD